MDEIAETPRFHGLILLKLSCGSHVMFTLLRRKDIRLAQRKAMIGSDPKKPLKVHGLREGIGQIRIAVPKRQEPIQILERHPSTNC